MPTVQYDVRESVFSFFSVCRTSFFVSVINCERASYGAPGFKKAITRTRAELLKELQPRYMAMQRRNFMQRSFARLGMGDRV
jgi:hypothetical protein